MVGQRVKRLRRGCKPTYGTVVEVGTKEVGPYDYTNEWVRVLWDTGVETHCRLSELTPVIRDRSHRRKEK